MADYEYFEAREREGVHVIHLAGIGNDREAVAGVGRELLMYAQQRKPQRVVISFKSVSRLMAPVVAKLLVFIKTVEQHGGKVECCEGPEGFGEVLGMIGRSLPFDHVDKSEAEVVEILRASGG
jgi:hypothetical protein